MNRDDRSGWYCRRRCCEFAWASAGPPTAGALAFARHARRGGGGTEYATEAGMRMYITGGNAVDAGIATMLAASVAEFSHFGLGGESPILVRTKEGKVFAIAGVGTMPKLATADFFRNHKLDRRGDRGPARRRTV